MQLAIRKWEWILGDRYHGLVFTQKKPVPNSPAMRHILIAVESVCVVVMMCLLAVHIVKRIIAEA